MTDSERLLGSIYSEIEIFKQARPFQEVVVYMTDECRAMIIKNLVCVISDKAEAPPVYDTIFGCISRRMIADGIRFAVAYENVFERSNENAE